MILNKTALIAYQKDFLSDQVDFARLRKVKFEGSIDFEVELLYEESTEQYIQCHLAKEDNQWLLGIELEDSSFPYNECSYINSVDVELEELYEITKNSQSIYSHIKDKKTACAIANAVNTIYQHQMDILN